MVEIGALQEAEQLLARGLDPVLPIMKAIGVREFGAYLAGDLALEDAIEAAQMQTRRYAKRQMTWFRGQMNGWPTGTSEELIDHFTVLFTQ
jgi:tRNA dimethylallyltransferase